MLSSIQAPVYYCEHKQKVETGEAWNKANSECTAVTQCYIHVYQSSAICIFFPRQLREVEQWNREVDGLDLLAISYQIHSTGDNVIYPLTCS